MKDFFYDLMDCILESPTKFILVVVTTAVVTLYISGYFTR
jgi:hypothetical protein